MDPETGTLLFQSRNIDKANIYGLELDHSWRINDQWSTAAGLAWTKGKNKISNESLDSISTAKAVVNINWNSSNQLWNAKLYTSYNRSKSSIDEDLFNTPAFTVVDLMLHRKLNNRSNLQLGLFNLFNQKYYNWQQVRNFDAEDPIIRSLSQPSRNFSLSYSIEI